MDGTSSSKRKPEAQRDGESSVKRLNVTVELESLDCPICFVPLSPPIFQCSVGHFICKDCCADRLDNKCHLCSVETSFERCFGMEHVLQSVTIACSNDKYGCAEKVTYYKKEEHKKACPYAPCFCPESGCGFAGPTKVLLDHFTIQHKCPSTTLPDSGMLSLYLQPGLHVLQCTGNNYFFLLNMASEPFGHAISIICVQPNRTESKFTCNMSYDCMTTGCCGSINCHIRSSSLSDGLPTVFDLILPKGKVSDDVNGILLRATIHHQPLSLSRSCFQGKGPTPALHQTHDTYHDGDGDEEDNIPLSLSRSGLRGETPTPAVQRRPDTYDDDDDDAQQEDEYDDRAVSLSRPQRICLDTDDEEDEIPLALRRSHPSVERSPDTYNDDAQQEEDEYDDRPVSLFRPRIIRRRIYSDTDEQDNIPLIASRARVR